MKNEPGQIINPLRLVLFLLLVIPLILVLGNMDLSPGQLLPTSTALATETPPSAPTTTEDELSFFVTADMRNFAGSGLYDTSQYFRGAAEAIQSLGKGAFMVTPGDIDPVAGVYWTITSTLGITYPWYPIVGNHELPGAGTEPALGVNLAWLNAYNYGIVNPGPASCPNTTFSFDYHLTDFGIHFVVLNEYCDSSSDHATTGDIPDYLYNWLVADLEATTQDFILVFGHEPAYVQPDQDTGRIRHLGDSLDQYPSNRDRFWGLMQSKHVVAYICGHTHNYSVVPVGGVWQVDAAHARGLGDTSAPSTFIIIHVTKDTIRFETYRDDSAGGTYTLKHGGYLFPLPRAYLPSVIK